MQIIAAPMSSSKEIQQRAKAHEKHQILEKQRYKPSLEERDIVAPRPDQHNETLQEKMRKSVKASETSQDNDSLLTSFLNATRSATAIFRRESARVAGLRSKNVKESNDGEES